MDPLIIGGLLLAATALDSKNNKKGDRSRSSHYSSRRRTDYDDGLAWQHDHNDLGI